MGYPLGNFQTSGATSLLPGKGGLPPDVGVNLEYFVDRDGFCRKMAPFAGTRPLMVWIDGLTTLSDDGGRQRLVAHYAVMKDLGHRVEHGLAVFDDHAQRFEKLASLDPNETWRFPSGHPVKVQEGSRQYCLLPGPFPVVRVQADLVHACDPRQYEAFTPLKPGTIYDKAATAAIDRDAGGKVVWGWKSGAEPITQEQERELIACGKLAPADAHFQLTGPDGGPVRLHSGSFAWNDYRRKWIMIGMQVDGTSFLGEVWYAQAPARPGPGPPPSRSSRTTNTPSTIPCTTPSSTAPVGGSSTSKAPTPPPSPATATPPRATTITRSCTAWTWPTRCLKAPNHKHQIPNKRQLQSVKGASP